MKKNNNKPRTIAILVNYNNNLDTSETIYNLLEQILSFYKIIVIDNCSTNNSFKILKEKFKTINDVIIIKSKKNGGFAYGNNFGIKYALENFKFDYFLVINNDTISDKEINSNFIEYFDGSNMYLNRNRNPCPRGLRLVEPTPRRAWPETNWLCL